WISSGSVCFAASPRADEMAASAAPSRTRRVFNGGTPGAAGRALGRASERFTSVGGASQVTAARARRLLRLVEEKRRRHGARGVHRQGDLLSLSAAGDRAVRAGL